MKSSSQYSFAQVPNVSRPRSRFDRSRNYKTTLDSGYLYPIYVDDVLPGDTFNVNLTAFMRMTTPIVPFMDNVYADFFFFFVPNRLVWEHWENFMGQQDNPGDSVDYLVPQVTPILGSWFEVGSLADYFGLPINVEGLSVDALPFRAYNLIWNEWFRDENLQDRAYETVGDDAVDDTNYPLLRRGKRHDYFTSALPWPQKGPGVELPLGTLAPVRTVQANVDTFANGIGLYWADASTGTGFSTANSNLTIASGGATSVSASEYPASGAALKPLNLGCDLSRATAATINSLRTAFQIQHLYEAFARGGTRYNELVLSCFNVQIPDARLQRPEYLGGGQIPINIHSVAQTSNSSSGNTPQGNLAAYGVAGGRVGFSKSFVEHGWVIGLVSIRADLTYQQGIDRMWSRRTRFDYYWPQLAHLGEAEIFEKEIYATGTDADDAIFGYQERWAEYRYGISHITGQLRSTYAQSLDVWHLAQEFENAPTLSSTFIEDNPPISRVLAVQNRPQFIYDSLISCNCVRVMPTYSVPGWADHF